MSTHDANAVAAIKDETGAWYEKARQAWAATPEGHPRRFPASWGRSAAGWSNCAAGQLCRLDRAIERVEDEQLRDRLHALVHEAASDIRAAARSAAWAAGVG